MIPAGGGRRIELHYNEAILRDAVRIFIWRRAVVAEKRMWAVVVAMGLLLLWLILNERPFWLVWLIGAVILVPVIASLMGWWLQLRRKLAQLRAMPMRRGTLLLGNDGIDISSAAGTTRVPWSGVTEYWVRPGYWMIFLAPNHFFTLPLAGIPAQDLAALRAGLANANSGPGKA